MVLELTEKSRWYLYLQLCLDSGFKINDYFTTVALQKGLHVLSDM